MNETLLKERLLAFAWQHSLFDKGSLRTAAGEAVTVTNPGTRTQGGAPAFRDAEVVVGDKTYVGAVAVMAASSDWYYRKLSRNAAFDGVVLNVVGNDDRVVRRLDDSVLPAVELKYPDELYERLKILHAGAKSCGRVMLHEVGEMERKSALARLLVERLERKYNDIMKVYASSGESWHETFHIMLFRTMGLNSNKEVYMSLAQNIPYSKLCRERGDPESIEAMIFGVAGLLDGRVYDEYKSRLTGRFDTLRAKHDLRILEYCEWTTRNVRPYNFAPKRLAQLSKLIDTGNFTFENVMACGDARQLKKLFDIELSTYWKRRISFDKRSRESNMGDMTVDIVIINLVAPMMFAYGRHTADETLQERAVDLLYEIPGVASHASFQPL